MVRVVLWEKMEVISRPSHNTEAMVRKFTLHFSQKLVKESPHKYQLSEAKFKFSLSFPCETGNVLPVLYFRRLMSTVPGPSFESKSQAGYRDNKPSKVHRIYDFDKTATLDG